MLEKILAWCGNVLLASVLVVLSSQNAVFAQETEATNGGDEPGRILVPLTGTATTKSVDGLEVTPASFDTGVVQVGETKTQAIILKHVGADDALPIEISTATLFGKNVDDYVTDFVGFITLNPGDEVEFDIVFTPTVPGTKSAGLRMDIEGATTPHVLLFNGWSRYPLTSDLGINTEKLGFGQIIQGGNSNKQFTLTNLGEPDAPVINVWSVDLSGDTSQVFNVNFNPLKINPGESVEVQVTMSGANLGFKDAIVVINHDGNNVAVETEFEGSVVVPQNVPINFGQSSLNNANLTRATSLQFGPGGKLYVAEMDGVIKVYAVVRNGKNNYAANLLDTITHIQNVPNHNDNGNPTGVKNRLLTGIFVTGTAAAPIIYAASSDPRQAAGPSGTDSGLDTNSGILHRLTKNGGGWNKQDMVRGLPRSEENHVPNGLMMYANKILLNMGGHTNMGAPSNNFAELPEYALSAAILEIDVNAIGNGTYDLPTLDDEDRPGVTDDNDPFGGNNGKNQAILTQNGPVDLFATGFRNAFDITLTESGKIYVFDNGPNPGWGGTPNNNCANNIDDGGSHHWDSLHLVTKNFYGGHPNPTRGNKGNTFNNSNPQSPIEGAARPQECDYKHNQASDDGALKIIQSSSNGLDEYTASNFLGSMKGDLLVASFNKSIYRLELNGAGTKVDSTSKLVENLGSVPLDLTTQGDNGAFPGTIWIADNLANTITVLEPSDY